MVNEALWSEAESAGLGGARIGAAAAADTATLAREKTRARWLQ